MKEIKFSKLKFLILSLIFYVGSCYFVPVFAHNYQQQRTIQGQVVDSQGVPLWGVTVAIKGTAIGTVTDDNGNFRLSVTSNDQVLVVSFVGMETKEIPVEDKLVFYVVLEEDAIRLDEVVVSVGYATQKKVNLTGSVAHIGSEEITRRPAPSVQNLLQGKLPGLQITQPGGIPGGDVGTMQIRGLGTFSSAGSSPLVLIDGVAGDMQTLNPNNIESVSVLKDASAAAIYGARAANGVILITTKRGKEQGVTVQYNVTLEAQQATRLPDLVWDSAEYMELWNEANRRHGIREYFTQADIDAFRNNPNDPNYPNFNWIDHVFRTAFAQNHHININGGSDRTTFNLGVGYLDQEGITRGYGFKRYNIHLAVDSRVNDWLAIGGNIQALRSDQDMDIQGAHNESYWVMHAYGPAPNFTPTMTLPDGRTVYAVKYTSNIGEWTVRNPDAILSMGSFISNRQNMSPQLYADVKLSENLTWHTKGAAIFDYRFSKNHEHESENYFFKEQTYAHNGGLWNLGVDDRMNISFLTTLYSTLNYNRVIRNNHNLGILAGYNQETADYRSLYGRRTHFPTYNLKELNAGLSADQTNTGLSTAWAIQSLFGRLTYNYKFRYLFEANMRYDGTSRISPENRWGVFPSFSGAWRISEEGFLKDQLWLDNLKLRASWGQLGNQNVGLYPYQDVLATTEYAFGQVESGVLNTRLVDQTLRWETTSITNFGVDLDIKNGLISIVADWYDKFTDGILYQIPIPASVGLAAPTVNGGQMRNRGWEFEIAHRHRVGNVRYSVDFNIAGYKNTVESILSPTIGTLTVQEGLPYNSYYLVEWIGIFQNEEEIANAPVHPHNPKPGDLRFKNQNDDNVINADDRVVVDGYHPKFYYGSNINASWRNFDVSVFIQGVEGIKNYILGRHPGFIPFSQGSPPTRELADNRWTPDNLTNEYPAIYRSNYGPVTGTASTFGLHDASYLRLKNLRVGYTIPARITHRFGIKNAQIYFSGDNLFTITDYPEADPERSSLTSNFAVYPQLTTYLFGFNVTL